nr:MULTISPECIES: type IV secretory system conjugative DNA transfer family protein [Xanthomonas]
MILAAPTRSGKGVGVVIPNLLDCQESTVVLDIKRGESRSDYRLARQPDREVLLFNLFAEDRLTHRRNPLA